MPEEFNEHLLQLIIGLQTTAWMALGKTINPLNQKTEVNLDLARDTIDTLLMLKEKTKGNLTETEKGILENAMQDLELNFVDVSKKQEENNKAKKKDVSEDNKGHENQEKEQPELHNLK